MARWRVGFSLIAGRVRSLRIATGGRRALTPGAGTLVWTSVAGKTYRVETGTDLMTWTDQGFDYPSDGNGTTTSIYMPPVGGTYFVRVVAKP